MDGMMCSAFCRLFKKNPLYAGFFYHRPQLSGPLPPDKKRQGENGASN
jgi:hypothetical protein